MPDRSYGAAQGSLEIAAGEAGKLVMLTLLPRLLARTGRKKQQD